MPERYWLTFTTRHRHGPPTQEPVYYQREGDRWRLYYGKAGRRRYAATDSTRMVEHQVDLARAEGRFVRHELDQVDQGRMFNPRRQRPDPRQLALPERSAMDDYRERQAALRAELERLRDETPNLRDFGLDRREDFDRAIEAHSRRMVALRNERERLGYESLGLPVPERFRNPLIRGYSRAAIGANVSREMHAGRPQDQAVAIALSTARRAYRARHPRGRLPAHLGRNPTMPTLANPRACPFCSYVAEGPNARRLLREHVDRDHKRYAPPRRFTGRGRARRRRNPVSMMQTGAGYYVSGACGTGGMGFPRGKDGKRAAQLYLYEQRRIEDQGGCRNPTDVEPMPDKPNRYLLRDRDTGRVVASGKDFTTAIRAGADRDRAERDRARRRRRNPDRGEWIDLLVPVAFLFLLIRGRVIQTGS